MAIDKEDVEKIARATADEVIARIGGEHDLKWFQTGPLDKIAEYLEKDEDQTADNYNALANRIEGMSPVWDWAGEQAEIIREIADQEEHHSATFTKLYGQLMAVKKTLRK
jgi:hypothetical protein